MKGETQKFVFSTLTLIKRYIPVIIFGTILTSALRLGLAISTQNAIDAALLHESIIPWVVIGFLAALSFAVGTFLKSFFSRKAAEKISLELRTKYFGRFIRSPFDETKIPFGEKIVLLTDDISNVSEMHYSWVDLLFGILQTVTGLIYCFFVSWIMTVGIVLCTLFSIYLNKYFMPKIESISAQKQEEESKIRTFMQDRLQHKDVSIVFSLAPVHELAFRSKYKSRIEKILSLEKSRAFFSNLSGFLGSSSVVFLIIAGVFLIRGNRLSIGGLMGFIEISSVLIWPFVSLSGILADISQTMASVKRLIPLNSLNQEHIPSKLNTFYPSKLCIRDLSFSYLQDKPVLSNMNLLVEKGEILVVSGGSGTGKSTLLKLLLSILTPTDGNISLEDGNVSVSGLACRNYIAYVPQQNQLFSGTIRENIRLGNLEISDEQMDNLAKEVRMHDFICNLKNGYDTPISELGKSLSEGQRQRIALMRAYAKNAPIILLDEVSSALDEESETVIINFLKRNASDRITIVVAHTEKMMALSERNYTIDCMYN